MQYFTIRQRSIAVALFGVMVPAIVSAQTSSLWQNPQDPQSNQQAMQQNPPAPTAPPLTLRDTSAIYVDPKPPRQIKIHDVLSVRVDHLSRMTAEGELQRRKNSRYDARLKDWIVLKGFRALGPAPQGDGDPRIRGELQSNYRSQGDMETRESLAVNVAVAVVDIRPNGNLVLEGHQRVRINEEVWAISLTGECAAKAVGPDNTVLSRDINHLDINKSETGSVASGYQRGWFQKLFDVFVQPF